jgi:hypothetical protein
MASHLAHARGVERRRLECGIHYGAKQEPVTFHRSAGADHGPTAHSVKPWPSLGLTVQHIVTVLRISPRAYTPRCSLIGVFSAFGTVGTKTTHEEVA